MYRITEQIVHRVLCIQPPIFLPPPYPISPIIPLYKLVLVWYNCYIWWARVDPLLLTTGHSLHWDPLFVLYGSMAFDKCIMTRVHITVSWKILSPPENPLCCANSSLSLPTTAGNHWSFYYVCSFAFSKMPNSWNHPACSLFKQTSST